MHLQIWDAFRSATIRTEIGPDSRAWWTVMCGEADSLIGRLFLPLCTYRLSLLQWVLVRKKKIRTGERSKDIEESLSRKSRGTQKKQVEHNTQWIDFSRLHWFKQRTRTHWKSSPYVFISLRGGWRPRAAVAAVLLGSIQAARGEEPLLVNKSINLPQFRCSPTFFSFALGCELNEFSTPPRSPPVSCNLE